MFILSTAQDRELDNFKTQPKEMDHLVEEWLVFPALQQKDHWFESQWTLGDAFIQSDFQEEDKQSSDREEPLRETS